MAMRESGPVPNALGREEQVRRLFARFGMEVSDVFKDRYLNDPWVYHLTNAAMRLQEENDRTVGIVRKAMGECGTSTTTHHLLRQIVPDWDRVEVRRRPPEERMF